MEDIPEQVNFEVYESEFGKCIISASLPHKKKLKKKFDLDIDSMDAVQQENFVLTVGVRMTSECPSILLRTAKVINKEFTDENRATENINYNNIYEFREPYQNAIALGILTRIKDSVNTVFFLYNEVTNVESEYIWFTIHNVDQGYVKKFHSLIGESVIITYHSQTLFDSGTGLYETYNVIESIE